MGKQLHCFVLTSALLVVVAFPVAAQDVMNKYKITGLRGVSQFTLVMTVNDETGRADMKEFSDAIQLNLRRNAPGLRHTADSPHWLQVSVVSDARGAMVGLDVYRWVTISESGERTFAKVWWDTRFLFGVIRESSGL